jgi:hypothetical protein
MVAVRLSSVDEFGFKRQNARGGEHCEVLSSFFCVVCELTLRNGVTSNTVELLDSAL